MTLERTSLVYAASDGHHRPASHPVYGGRLPVAQPVAPDQWDGSALRTRRLILGWSQGRLAAALGVTRNAVSQWETSAVIPPRPRREAIERLVGRLRP